MVGPQGLVCCRVLFCIKHVRYFMVIWCIYFMRVLVSCADMLRNCMVFSGIEVGEGQLNTSA